MQRKPFLDNIRSFTVILVMFYHVAYLFNGVGILGAVPNSESIPLFDGLAALVYPWFMVLLFLVAGISASYALRKRLPRDFIRERARKLLIPSTLGLFVFQWMGGYLNMKIGGGLEYIPAFLVYPISTVSGIGPLWFAQMLFLFSALLLLLKQLPKKEKLSALGQKTPGWMLPLLCLPLWLMSYVGNLPVLTMYRFGIYFTAFLLGYLIFSNDRVQECLRKRWMPLTLAALPLAALYLFFAWGRDFTASSVLQSPLTNLYAWMACLALIGVFARYFDRETAVTAFFARHSFGWYTLHYPVVLAMAVVFADHTALPALAKYALTLLVTLVGTFLLDLGIRRIPVVRFLVLGIKKK